MKEIPPSDGKNKTIIFCNTLGSARSLHVWLSAAPEAVEALGGSSKLGALHSRIPKEVSITLLILSSILIIAQERWTVIEDFKEGRLSTLICTDIASRGLDTTFVCFLATSGNSFCNVGEPCHLVRLSLLSH